MDMKEKHFEIDIDLFNVHFPTAGRYHISLTLVTMPEPPGGHYENVHVRLKPEDAVLDHVTRTDSVDQRTPPGENRPPTMISFRQGKVIFTVPGVYFTSEDKEEHQVMVLLECIREELDREVVDGKATVNVYPQPLIKTEVPQNQPWYTSTEVLVLARLLEADSVPITCGRLACTTSLSEVPPPPGMDREVPSAIPQTLPDSPRPETIIGQQSKEQEVAFISTSLTDIPKSTHPRAQPLAPPSPAPPHTPMPPAPRVLRTPVPPPSEDVKKQERRMSVLPSNVEQLPPILVPELLLPELPDVKVNISPRAEDREAAGGGDYGPVSARGTEDVTVMVHAVANLPTLPGDNRLPTPFVTLGLLGGVCKESTTRTSIQPTCNPTWHEVLNVVLPKTTAKDTELVLSVADSGSHQLLVNYQIPVSFLHPFHHYHLNMVTTVKNHTGGVHLYVSILRRAASLPETKSKYSGLEVTLQGVREPLKSPCRPLLAIARLEEDLEGYQRRVGEDLSQVPGVQMTMVTFPSPHPTWFQVPEHQTTAVPQLSMPGEPAEQPQWDHIFAFTSRRDVSVMTAPLAALVIELYPLRAPKTTVWGIEGAIGYSTLLLTANVYHQLAVSQKVNLGLKVNKLPIQGGILKTIDNKTPSLDLIIRIITDEEECGIAGSLSERSHLQQLSYSPPSPLQPLYNRDSTELCFSDINLEVLDESSKPHPVASGSSLTTWMAISPRQSQRPGDSPHPQHTRRSLYKLTRDPTRFPPIYTGSRQPKAVSDSELLRAREQPTDGELPSHDALENLLPAYGYIVKDDAKPRKRDKELPSSPRPEDVERVSMSLLDYQQQELEKYRAAVQTMGQDLLGLREHIRQLEEHNSRLRRDLDHYNDSTRLLLDAQELDGLSRADIAERYVALKHNLNRQASELRDYKDKVLKVQNELIKKNDREKEYGRLSEAHTGQQATLQRLQERSAKVRRLEDVIRKQEKVIDRMEKIINSRTKAPRDNKDRLDVDDTVKDALMEENKRLRNELEHATRQKYSSVAEKTSRDAEEADRERLELYTRVERTEGRIQSLEKQLSENARQWAREKSDLLLKLRESDVGLSRNSPLPSPLTVPKPRPRRTEEPSGEPRRFSRYFREPSPERKHKPHIGYRTPLYDPVLHS